MAEGLQIPEHAIEWKFIRASGPGGQHVNKTSSACEGRLVVPAQDWIPEAVKQRLLEQQRKYVNSESAIVVSSQEERSQHQNRARVLRRFQDMINQAMIEPKVREMMTGVSDVTKANWIREKKQRSSLKSLRIVDHRKDY